MVAASKVDRFVVCAIDMDYLPRTQVDANASRRVPADIGRTPHHDMHSALAGAMLVEGDYPLAADGGKNGLWGPTGPRFWAKSSARAGTLKPLKASRNPSPTKFNLKSVNMVCLLLTRLRTILSLERSLNWVSQTRCDLCHKGAHFLAHAPLTIPPTRCPAGNTFCWRLPCSMVLSCF